MLTVPRIDFVVFVDVTNGNPNGDPNYDNMPRTNYLNGKGFITDACLKRKIRNTAENRGYPIYYANNAILQNVKKAVYAEEGIPLEVKGKDKDKTKHINQVQTALIKKFIDIRFFGAVMSTSVNAGNVQGPVQITFAESLEKINPITFTITRHSVETEDESVKQDSENRTMGRKHIIPYGLYRFSGSINAIAAEKIGFTCDDLEIFKDCLVNMFEDDISASRGIMGVQKIFAFVHDNKYGSGENRAQLIKRIKYSRKDATVIPTSFDDCNITVDTTGLPSGIKLEEWGTETREPQANAKIVSLHEKLTA